MSFLGSLHVAAAALALIVAAIVLVRTEGTTAHVRLGRIYVVLLILVDAFALLTYQNGIGPFHILAVISFGHAHRGSCLVAAPARYQANPRDLDDLVGRRTRGRWLAQGATAALPQARPWPTVATMASVCLLATLATRAVASSKAAVGSTSRSRWT